MARPLKKGLDYFPMDVDMFDDPKIEAIGGEFGIKGELAVIKLLCAVYRNGYFIPWNDLLKMQLVKQLPSVTADLLDQIVSRLVKWEFFDERLFNSAKVLTSRGIQNRYLHATKRRKEDEITVYDCLNPSTTGVIVDINPYSKGKDSKEGANAPSEAEVRFEKFTAWLKKYASRVTQLKEPITLDQFTRLSELWEKSPEAKELHLTLLKEMHNHKPLLTKNVSAYETLLNWTRRRQQAA